MGGNLARFGCNLTRSVYLTLGGMKKETLAGAMITAREVAARDWQIWRDLRFAALRESPNAFGETLEHAMARPESEWIRLAVAPKDSTLRPLLVEHDGRPVGIALVELEMPRAKLYAMWVAPEARRLGAGGALVATAIQVATAASATELVLRVSETQPEAFSLYRKYGFLEAGDREPLRDGSEVQAQTMSCLLRSRYAA